MAILRQLSLLIRKQGLLKLRKPAILSLQVLWPLAFLAGIIVLRQLIPPLQQNVCYYNARAMPSAGLLPFLQSFICNIDNKCLKKENYDEIPKYEQAQLKQISNELTPLFEDEKVNQAIKSLPKAQKLVEVLHKTLGNAEVKEIIFKGIKVSDLLKDPGALKRFLVNDVKVLEPDAADALLNSRLNIQTVLGMLGEDNLNSTVCDPSKLSKYLTLTDPSMIFTLSKSLCDMDIEIMSKLLMEIQNNINVKGILKKVIAIVDGLGEVTLKNGLDDVLSMLKVIENLTSLKNITSLKVPFKVLFKILPAAFDVINSIRNSEIDLELLEKLIHDIPEVLEVNDYTKQRLKTAAKLVSLIMNMISNSKALYPDSDIKLKNLFANPKNAIETIKKKSNTTLIIHESIFEAQVLPTKLYYLVDSNIIKMLRTLCEFPKIENLFEYEPKKNLINFQSSFCALNDNDAMDLLREDFSFIKKKNGKDEDAYDYFKIILNLYGKNVTDLLEELIPIPKSWDNLPWILNKLDKLFNILTFYYRDPFFNNTSPSFHYSSTALEFAEVLLNTLSNPIKMTKLMMLRDSSVFCSNSVKTYLDISSHINTDTISKILCNGIKDFEYIFSSSEEGETTLESVVIKIFDFFHSFMFLPNHFDELNGYVANVESAWNNFRMSYSSAFILNVRFLEFLDSKLSSSNSNVWLWIRSELFALHELLSATNDDLKKAITSTNVTLDLITSNLPYVNDVITNSMAVIPDFMNAFGSLFEDQLQPLILKALNAERFSFPCQNGFTFYLNFSDPSKVLKLEKIICNHSEGNNFIRDVYKFPLVAFVQSLFQPSKKVNLNWSEFIFEISEFQKNINTTIRTDISYFPDIVDLGQDIRAVYDDMKGRFMLNSNENILKFTLNIVDQGLGAFYEKHGQLSIKHGDQTFAEAYNLVRTERNMFYAPSIYKFVFYSLEKILYELDFMTKNYTGSEFELTDLFVGEPLRNVAQIVSNLPKFISSIINSLVDLKYSEIRSLNNICSDKQLFNSVFSSKRYPYFTDNLHYLLCKMPNAIQNPLSSELGNDAIPLVKTINELVEIWHKNHTTDLDLSFGRIYDAAYSLNTDLLLFSDHLPSFIGNIFDASKWIQIYKDFFEDPDFFTNIVLRSIFDKPIQFIYSKFVNGSSNSSYSAGIIENWNRNTMQGYVTGILYTMNFAFYAVNEATETITAYIHKITSGDLSIVDFLPYNPPMSYLANIISNAEVLFEFAYVGCGDSHKVAQFLITHDRSNVCNQSSKFQQILNNTKLSPITSDIVGLYCADYTNLTVAKILETDTNLNPGQKIIDKLQLMWNTEEPNPSYFSTPKLKESFMNMINAFHDINENSFNITVPSKLKSLFNAETWDKYLQMMSKRPYCLHGYSSQLAMSMKQLYDEVPASRPYLYIIQSVVAHVHSVITSHEGGTVKLTDFVSESPEAKNFMMFLETNLPEITEAGFYSSSNVSSDVYEALLKSENIIADICNKPYDTFIHQPPNTIGRIDIKSLHSQFCAFNFSQMLFELKQEMKISERNLTLDFEEFSNEIISIIDDIAKANITLDSRLIDRANWNNFENYFTYNSSRSLLGFYDKILVSIKPSFKRLIDLANEIPELRYVLNIIKVQLTGVKIYTTFNAGFTINPEFPLKVYYKPSSLNGYILNIGSSFLNVLDSVLTTIYHPKMIANLVEDIASGKNIQYFCQKDNKWNEYVHVPDNISASKLDNFQEAMCKIYFEVPKLKIFQPNFYDNITAAIANNNIVDSEELYSNVIDIFDFFEPFAGDWDVVTLPSSNNLSAIMNTFGQDLSNQFDPNHKDFGQIISNYMVLALRRIPISNEVLHHLRLTIVALESISNVLTKLDQDPVITEISSLMDALPNFKPLVNSLENNALGLIRIFAYTGIHNLNKLLLLKNPENVGLFCTDPEKILSVPPGLNISLVSLFSKFCSLNFTIDLGSNITLTNTSYDLELKRFDEGLKSVIKLAIKVIPELRFEHHLLSKSNWESIVQDITHNRTISTNNVDLIKNRIIEILTLIPDSYLSFTRPLEKTLASVYSVFRGKLDSYPGLAKLHKIYQLSKTFIKNILFLFRKQKFQLLPDVPNMLVDACKDISEFDVLVYLRNRTETHDQICDVVESNLFPDLRKLFAISEWKSNLSISAVKELNITLTRIIYESFNMTDDDISFYSSLLHATAHPDVEMILPLMTPLLSYVVNMTSTTTPMLYTWEILSSAILFAEDVYRFSTFFLEPDIPIRFYLPNFISDEKNVALRAELSLDKLLNHTRKGLDAIFDEKMVREVIQDFVLTDKPFQTFCKVGNFSKYIGNESDEDDVKRDFCRHFIGSTAIHDPLNNWINDIKNGIIGKVDSYSFLSSFVYLMSHTPVRHVDKEDLLKRYNELFNPRIWKDMFQNHFIEPFSRKFLNQTNAEEYFETLRETLNHIDRFKTARKLADYCLSVYNSLLEHFKPGGKTIADVFEGTNLLGELVYIVTDAEFWQNSINTITDLNKVSHIIIDASSSVCKTNIVYDLGLSAGLTDSLVNMLDIVCHYPDDLRKDVKSFFKIDNFHSAMHDSVDTNSSKIGELLINLKNNLFITKDYIYELKKNPDPWLDRVFNLSSINAHSVVDHFKSLNASGFILYFSGLDPVMKQMIPVKTRYYYFVAMDVTIKCLNSFWQVILDHLQSGDTIKFGKLLVELVEVSLTLQKGVFVDEIMYDLSYILGHLELTQKLVQRCQEKYGHFNSIKFINETFCHMPPDQWTVNVKQLLSSEYGYVNENLLFTFLSSTIPNHVEIHSNTSINWRALDELTTKTVKIIERYQEMDFNWKQISFLSILKTYWYSLPTSIRKHNNCHAQTTFHYHKMPKDWYLTGDVLQIGISVMNKIPALEGYLCRLWSMNLTEAYNEFMHNIGMKDILIKLRKVYYHETNSSATCFDIQEDFAVLVERIQSYIDTHNTEKWYELNLCLNDAKRSPLLKKMDSYLRLLGDVDKLNSTNFNISNTFHNIETNLRPILDEMQNIFAPEYSDLFIRLSTIGYSLDDGKSLIIYELFNPYGIEINIDEMMRVNFSAPTIKTLICDPDNIERILVRYSHEKIDVTQLCNDDTLLERFIEAIKTSPAILDAQSKRKNSNKSFKTFIKIFANIGAVLKNTNELTKLGDQFSEFQNGFGDMSISNITSSVIKLLNERKLANIILHLQSLLKSLNPVFPHGSRIYDDLQTVLTGIRGLKTVTNKALTDLTYRIKDLFEDVESLKKFMIDELKFSITEVDAILNGELNIGTIFKSESNFDTGFFCDSNKLSTLINLTDSNDPTLIKEISNSFCRLSLTQLSVIFDKLARNINTTTLVNKYMEFGFSRILEKANLTKEEVISTIQSLKLSKEIIPMLKSRMENITEILKSKAIFQEMNLSSVDFSDMPLPKALRAAGSIMCGNPLEVLDNKLTLIEGDEKSNKLEPSELNSLPTEYCQNMYRKILSLSHGPLIWGFLKPIMQGRVLYTPDTQFTQDIMRGANSTFKAIGDFSTLLQQWSNGINSLQFFRNSNSTFKELKDVMNSTVIKDIMRSVFKSSGKSGDNINISQLFGMTSLIDQIGDIGVMAKILALTANVSQCFNADRFHGYQTEDDVIKAARAYGKKGQFLAGIVFMDIEQDQSGRNKRDADYEIPKNLKYKIRMDVDSVPYTKYLKDRYWRPIPKDNFAYDLQYQHGFIQLQDMIDRAIVKLRSPDPENISLPQIYSQQFPNPCFSKDEFGYYLKGMLPVIMTMAWLFLVCFLISDKVLERELHLEQLMRVMGLSSVASFLSWFLLNFIIVSFIVVVMVLMLKLGQVIIFTHWLILLVFLLVFGFSIIMFCYCVSVFFKTATVGALTGLILYLMFYLPFVIMLAMESNLILYQKLLTSLLMSSSFSFGCLYLARFEELGVGVQWSNIWESPIRDDEMSFAYALVMLAVDGILYGIIGWYISNVFPAQIGVKGKCFYFFLCPTYWGCRKSIYKYSFHDSVMPLACNNGNLTDVQNNCEMEDYNGTNIGLCLSHLKVVYNQGKKDEKVAVRDVSMKLYQNQITTLLGQNGAGKTTAINVLTGQNLPTHGLALINGIDVVNNFSEARKTIGYCPQVNVLFETMTIREHLQFYGQLKGLMSKFRLDADIQDLISSMGLERLQNELIKNISGGMKRRLCVALAFVGGSTTIILDEPSSGVDPLARRNIWDLILKHKKGRTILLTTHYMDEADILSDRIAVVHDGRLLCNGSSMYLKNRYGSGYLLSVETTQKLELEEKISNPSLSASYLSGGSLCAAQILQFLKKFVPSTRLVEGYNNHSKFSIPYLNEVGERINLEDLFAQLENTYDSLGIISYNLSCTTLEEVFLKICAKADSVSSLNVGSSSPKLSISSSSSEKGFEDDIESTTEVCDLINQDAWITGSSYGIIRKDATSKFSMKFKQFSALFYKRFWHNVRNWRVIFCNIILPCIFIASAMGFNLIRPESERNHSLMLTPTMYGPHANSFVSFDEKQLSRNVFNIKNKIYAAPGVGTYCLPNKHMSRKFQCIEGEQEFSHNYLTSTMRNKPKRTCTCEKFYPVQKCKGEGLGFEPSRIITNSTDIIYNLGNHDINQYFLLSYQDFLENRYGGWSSADLDALKIWYDTHGFHSLPAYYNSLTNAFLRSTMSDATQYGVTTYNHPIYLTSKQLIQETITQRASEVGISLIFLIGFCFIPSGFVMYLVKERMSEEKRLQFLSGVSPVLYWLTTYAWDTLMMIVAVFLSTIIMLIFNIPIYTAGLNLPATILLLFLFCWSTTPLMYILEKLFSEASIASMVLYCFNGFIAVNTLICILILTLFQHVAKVTMIIGIVDKIFLIFPHYALGSGLLKLSRNQIRTEIYRKFGHDAYENPFDFLQINFIVMVVQALIFFFINLILESRYFCCPKRSYSKDSGLPLFEPEDIDVQDERKRVNSDDQSDTLKMINLTKVYKGILGRNVAVDKLCLGLKKGECFGLLGVNGAGKTTTFRMLSGDIQPTWGQVMVKNKILSEELSECSQLIGYCPQADALDDFLTCKEALKVYAKLKGVRSSYIDVVIHQTLRKYGLEHYSGCLTSKLSGGTKRKMCTAIASLGNCEIILMDEPTSGMDPKTRRLVWNNILTMVKDQKAVLLTSHSMEECDILCNRLAIMVNGRLKCLGTPQHLKNKFNDGYLVTLSMKQKNIDLADIMRFFSQNFPLSTLKALDNNIIQFAIPSQDVTLSQIFHHVESELNNLNIEDFSVNQTSLDQVFVNFAREQSDGIIDKDEVPLHCGDVQPSGSQHINAAYNKIYGLPDAMAYNAPDKINNQNTAPNMYFSEDGEDPSYSITKL